MLVRPMAINYSFWSTKTTRVYVLPPTTQACCDPNRRGPEADQQVPASVQPTRVRVSGRLRTTVQSLSSTAAFRDGRGAGELQCSAIGIRCEFAGVLPQTA